MTLITCSNYNIELYRLFDTFRQHNPADKIIWVLADKQPLNIGDEGLIKEYFGNMEIVYHYADKDFWGTRQCLKQPQWTVMAQVAYTLPDNEIIVRCDGTDVSIQRKCIFSDMPDNHIYCAYEGMLYKDNNCCYSWFDTAKKETYKNSPVINSGVLVMTGKTFKTLTAEMGYGNNPGTYCDQNLFQCVCDKMNIKLLKHIDILAAYKNKYHIKDGSVYKDGHIPAIAHFNAKNGHTWSEQYQYLEDDMNRIFSVSKCKSIEQQILGKGL